MSENLWCALAVFGVLGTLFISYDVRVNGYKHKSERQFCFERGGSEYIQAQYEVDSLCVFKKETK